MLFVKRITDMPGDEVIIRDGHVYLNDSEMSLEKPYIRELMAVEPEKTFQVPEDAYFCMGDNRNKSIDACYRKGSYVYKSRVFTKALFRCWLGIEGTH